MIRFFAWALAAVFLVETAAAFTWGRARLVAVGPVSLVLGLWRWLSPARGERGLVFIGHTACRRLTDDEHIARLDHGLRRRLSLALVQTSLSQFGLQLAEVG
jgi:hypothetical protein